MYSTTGVYRSLALEQYLFSLFQGRFSCKLDYGISLVKVCVQNIGIAIINDRLERLCIS